MIQYFLLHLYVIFYFICADCWFYNRNKTLHFEDRTGSCRQAKNKVMTYSAAPNKQSSSPAMWYAIIRILQNFITNLQVMGRHRGFHFCQGQRIFCPPSCSDCLCGPTSLIFCESFIQWVSRDLWLVVE